MERRETNSLFDLNKSFYLSIHLATMLFVHSSAYLLVYSCLSISLTKLSMYKALVPDKQSYQTRITL